MKKKFFNILPGQNDVCILLYGDVGDGQKVDAGQVVYELITLEKEYKKIDVRINSNGGDVFSGIAIYNALKNSKADITIYVDGVAASIAAIIALCGKPLYMSPYAKLMLHAVSGGTYGNASELRQTADMIESLQQSLATMISGRCGMKASDILNKYFDEKDHWLSASEALNMKLCDGIYEMKDAQDIDKQMTVDETYKFFNKRINNKNNFDMLKEDIQKIPSFANKSDDEIVNYANELVNKAANAETLRSANEVLKTKIIALEAKEVDSFLNDAVQKGKITEASKEHWKKIMAEDKETAMTLINSMKVTSSLKAKDVYKDASNSSFEGKTWDDIDKAGMLSNLKNTNIELFKNLFKEKFGADYVEK